MTTIATATCVPLKDRSKNDVDVRLEQIAAEQGRVKQIQAVCWHNYRFDEVIEFEATKKEGFFLPKKDQLTAHLQCLKCSDRRSVLLLEMCTKCFGDMIEIRTASYSEHFEGNSIYASVEYQCKVCRFGLVLIRVQPLV